MKREYYVIIKSKIQKEIQTPGWQNTGGPYIFTADISTDNMNWDSVKIRALTISLDMRNKLKIGSKHRMELEQEGSNNYILVKC